MKGTTWPKSFLEQTQPKGGGGRVPVSCYQKKKKSMKYFFNLYHELEGNAHGAGALRPAFVEWNCPPMNYGFSI